MYKVQIDISDWDEESVAIETSDFNKVQIIQEFIEFQQENGWTSDYFLVIADGDDEDEDEDEAEEDAAPDYGVTITIK